MEVRSLTMYAPNSLNRNTVSKRNISFGDYCGYIPNRYDYSDAMENMKKRGYVIQGYNNKNAFERLYDDVAGQLANRASKSDAVWIEEYRANSDYQDNRAIKDIVCKWKLAKEDVAGLLTRFWERNKNDKFNNTNAAVKNFLINSEGMKKPNFFQMFMPKFATYIERDALLTTVVNIFLKEGRHRLR